ncbi:MAG: cytochrome C oxidase subunit IV family protein [Bacteroidota bacterium]
MSEETTSQVEVQPVDKTKIRLFLKVTLILFVVTAFEFLIAFTMSAGPIKTFIFIALTIVKAFYIVGEFMHLSHERKSLIWSIMLPTMFIVFLIFILMYQGAAIYELLNG